MSLTREDIGRIRWAVRGAERVLQQAVYVIKTDSVEWRNIEERLFPIEKFEPQ